MTERKNNLAFLAAGIVFCLICLICAVLAIYSITDTLSEKSRLESLGATVNLKLTWLFFADIAAAIISGIAGVVFICKGGTKHESIVEVEQEESENKTPKSDIPYDSGLVVEQESEESEKFDGIDSFADEKHTVKTGGGLRINRGSSGSTPTPMPSDEGKSVHSKDGHDSKPSGSSYFSSGDDL